MSLVAFAAERLFNGLRYLPPQLLLLPRTLTQSHSDTDDAEYRKNKQRRARWRDMYVLGWIGLALVGMAICLGGLPVRRAVAGTVCALAASRVIDIIQSTVNIAVFDRLRAPAGTYRITSLVRSFVLSTINYFELLLWFALVYAMNPTLLQAEGKPVDSFWDCLYFSIATQLTVGYGDVLPEGAGRSIASFQALTGFFFSLLILGRIISLFPRPASVIQDDE